MFEILSDYFISPKYLLLAILLIFAMMVLTGTNKRLYLTRAFILIFLIIALAEPFSPFSVFGGGSSKLIILEDNSTSYTLFEENLGERTIDVLNDIDPEYSLFGESLKSNAGDAMIESMNDGKNILLLSDGNINYGERLEKVRETAVIGNLSISLIRQEPLESDYAIKIIGPTKIGPDTDISLSIVVKGSDEKERNVQLIIDGKEVLNGKAGALEYTDKFKEGYHEITARITEKDFFPENNIYYHTLKVVEKPKILLYGSEGTPLHKVLNQLYDVSVGELFGLDKYHAIVIDDTSSEKFSDRIGELRDYVENGNGLVVVGGENSFEYGGYGDSNLEDLLPVKVSGAGKKGAGTNIVLIIDLSGSTGEDGTIGKSQQLASQMITGLKEENNVGVIMFASEIIAVKEMQPISAHGATNLISWINGYQSTTEYQLDLVSAMKKATDMLGSKGGGKNVILFGDGDTGNMNLAHVESEGCELGLTCEWIIADPTLNKMAGQYEIKIYSVKTGNDIKGGDYEILSILTNGAYFPSAFAFDNLKLLFGDPTQGSSAQTNVKIEDDSHFITEDLLLTPTIYGTNEVLPKDSAQLLLASANGQPVLSVWRVGLGRVAVLSTDDGNKWAGEMYSGGNSKIISRLVNWGTGDPERKNSYFFSVNDPRVEEEFEIVVKSDAVPKIEDYTFEKKSDGTYVTKGFSEDSGFFKFGDDKYSVNYNSEYDELGVNEELGAVIRESGGRVFEADDDLNDVATFMKEKKNILKVEKELLIWPLIALAMVIFILDVWFRTIQERKNI